MGSSPTGHPTKKSADALHRWIFYLVGCPVGSNKAALTHQRQSSQQPSGLLVSLRVPISRNVYQDKCCADALHRRIFLFGGRAQWGSNKAALTHQRQSNQQPSGLLVGLRVPIRRNVYRGTSCRCSKKRIFYLAGCPSGALPPRQYFLLKKHVQALWKTVVSRGLHMLFCSALFLYCSQRFICCRICAISALE